MDNFIRGFAVNIIRFTAYFKSRAEYNLDQAHKTSTLRSKRLSLRKYSETFHSNNFSRKQT